MCLPDSAQCDACARPRFKRVSPGARRAGRALGFFLVVHLACALARPLSFAFSAALTDAYVVTYGYYISRRFFRSEGAEPVNGICLSCESQQNVVCFLMLVAVDFGLSSWTLLELFQNKPVIPTPVGLPQFDYRTMHIWQWYTGIVTAITVLVVLAAEIISGWYVHARLEAEEADLRYDKMIARGMGMEEGNGLMGDGSRGSFAHYGVGSASNQSSAPLARDVNRSEGSGASNIASVATPEAAAHAQSQNITEEERARRREHIARAAEHRVVKTTRYDANRS
eukprot:g3853.t1